MRCNNCGYPNQPTALKCERCNYGMRGSLNQAVKAEENHSLQSNEEQIGKTVKAERSKALAHDMPKESSSPESKHSPSQVPAPKGLENARKVTVGIHRDAQLSTRAIQLQRIDVKGQVEDFSIELVINDSKELSRENLDPDNDTITSKVQAVVTTDKDGRLFIENQSNYESTYLLIQEKIELKHGDKVMMGNRVFLVKKEKLQQENSKKTKPLT